MESRFKAGHIRKGIHLPRGAKVTARATAQEVILLLTGLTHREEKLLIDARKGSLLDFTGVRGSLSGKLPAELWQAYAEDARREGKPVTNIILPGIAELPEGMESFQEIEMLGLPDFQGLCVDVRKFGDDVGISRGLTINFGKGDCHHWESGFRFFSNDQVIRILAKEGSQVSCDGTYPPLKDAYQLQYYDSQKSPVGKSRVCDGHRYFREPKEFFRGSTNHQFIENRLNDGTGKGAVREFCARESLNGQAYDAHGNKIFCGEIVSHLEAEIGRQFDNWNRSRIGKFTFSMSTVSSRELLEAQFKSESIQEIKMDRSGAALITDGLFGRTIMEISERFPGNAIFNIVIVANFHGLLLRIDKSTCEDRPLLVLTLIDPNSLSPIINRSHGPSHHGIRDLSFSRMVFQTWPDFCPPGSNDSEQILALAWDDVQVDEGARVVLASSVGDDDLITSECIFLLTILNDVSGMKKALSHLRERSAAEIFNVLGACAWENRDSHPLTEAALAGFDEIVELLLELCNSRSADLSVDQKYSLLRAVTSEDVNFLYGALYSKNQKCIQVAVDGIFKSGLPVGLIVGLFNPPRGRVPFLFSLVRKDCNSILSSLVKSMVDGRQDLADLAESLFSQLDDSRETVLWHAQRSNDAGSVKALISPIFASARIGIERKISLLIALIHIPDQKEARVGDLLDMVFQSMNGCNISPAERRIYVGAVMSACLALIRNRGDSDSTRIHKLARNGDGQAVTETLIEILAKVPGVLNIGRLLCLVDDSGRNILHLLAESQNPDATEGAVGTILDSSLGVLEQFRIIFDLLSAKTSYGHNVLWAALTRLDGRGDECQFMLNRIAASVTLTLAQKTQLLGSLMMTRSPSASAWPTLRLMLAEAVNACSNAANERLRLSKDVDAMLAWTCPTEGGEALLHRYGVTGDFDALGHVLTRLYRIGGIPLMIEALSICNADGQTLLWRLEGKQAVQKFVSSLHVCTQGNWRAHQELLVSLVRESSTTAGQRESMHMMLTDPSGNVMEDGARDLLDALAAGLAPREASPAPSRIG